MQVPENIEKAIKLQIHRDLSPTDAVAYWKSGVALLIGGALSLFLCGQFGMGLTSTATEFNHSIHHGVGMLGCAAICGALFAVVPALVLRFLSNPMQFRALLRKKWQPTVVWIIAIGSLLSYHGDFGFEWGAVVVWVIAAYSVFRVAGQALDYANSRSFRMTLEMR